MNKSDNTSNSLNNDKSDKIRKHRRAFFLKIALIILIISSAIGVSFLFFVSDTAISEIVANKFAESTGFKLNIEKLYLKPLKGKIILKNTTASTSTGKSIAFFNNVTLQLGLSDLYDLYINNTLQAESLELSGIKLSDIPYSQLINTIDPDNVTADYNLKIASFLSKMHIDFSTIYLKKQTENTFKYHIHCKFAGKYSGGGEISGILTKDMKLTASLPKFNFNLTEKGIKTTYSGTLKYQDAKCSFEGSLSTNKSPLAIIDATPLTTYTGSGIWSFNNNTITVDQATITNSDGLLLNAKGSILNPTDPEQYLVSANISDSKIQLHDLSIKDNTLNIGVPDDFRFTGDIVFSPKKLDI